MPRQAALLIRPLLFFTLAWQVVVSIAVSFMCPRSAMAQEAPERSSLLVIPAHSSAGSAKLPSGVGESIESIVLAYLRRSGHAAEGLGKSQAASCRVSDYACLASAGNQQGRYLLDPLVQVNPDGTGYLTFTIADSKNLDNISSESVALGTPNSGHALAKEVAKNPEVITHAVGKLVKRVFSHQPAPVMVEQPNKAVTNASTSDRTLTLEVSGRGEVLSKPEGITCPGNCAHTFAFDSITLTAKPRLPASIAQWSGVPCTNSQLADPLHCQLLLTKNERLQINFDRSPKRKVLTGLLWTLAIGGAASGAVMLALDDQACTVASGGKCYRNYRGFGATLLTVGVGFGIGGALVYWLPK